MKNQKVAMERYLEFRDGPQGWRFVDVGYTELVETSKVAVRRIYEHIGVSFSQAVAEGIDRWEREHPQHVAGSWAYQLDDFHLSEADITKTLGEYIDRFGHLF
jgi:hypothetical protein